MKIVEGGKVSITREELFKINRIVGHGGWIRENIKKLLGKEGEEFIVSLNFICEISDVLSTYVNRSKQFLEGIVNVNKELGKQLSSLLDSYPSENCLLYRKVLEETELGQLVANNEMIDQVYEIFLLEKKLYKLKDYGSAKEDIRKNLTYFCSEEVIRKIEEEYNEKYNLLDIDGLAEVLNRAQQLILNHWKEYVTSIQDYTLGKPYNFLCHSTYHSDFKGDFYSRYVSCSLLSEELTDTYRRGFGFILSPDNIVLASGNDMYVRNDAPEEEDLLYYSSIKKIASPERVKEEATRKKEEGRKNKKYTRVYTEVVVDGFHPIAIFYLYDGIKEFDYNYLMALELKEKFPQLELVPLDITQHKTKEESYEVRKSVIEKVKRALDPNGGMTSNRDEYVKNFDYFWKKYLRLIKTKDYTMKDIIRLYCENMDLLQPNNSLFQNLLDGKCDSEEIEQVLYYNYQTRIIDIFENKASIEQLDSLFQTLKRYKDHPRLEEFVPGISLFFKLYPYVHLRESSNIDLKKCNSMESLNNYLSYLIYEKGEYTTSFEVDNLKEEYLQGNITYDSIHNLYKKLKDIQDTKGLDTVSFDVLLFMRLYPATKIDSILLEKFSKVDTNDFGSINELLLESLSRKQENVSEKMKKYETKLNSLEQEKKDREKTILDYEKATRCCEYEYFYSIAKKDIESIQAEVEGLRFSIFQSEQRISFLKEDMVTEQNRIDGFQKHKIFNFFKIKREKEKKSDEEINVSNLESSLYVDKLLFDQMVTELNNLKRKFEEDTGFAFDTYEEEMYSSKNFIKDTDLLQIRYKITNLDHIINRLRNILENYQKEIVGYESLESWFKK